MAEIVTFLCKSVHGYAESLFLFIMAFFSRHQLRNRFPATPRLSPFHEESFGCTPNFWTVCLSTLLGLQGSMAEQMGSFA